MKKKTTVEDMVSDIRLIVIDGELGENREPDFDEIKRFARSERKRLKKLKHAGVPQSEWFKNVFERDLSHEV